MEKKSNNIYKKIERLFKGVSICLLITIFLVQAYIYYSSSDSILPLNKLNNNVDSIVKHVAIIPEHGELTIKINKDPVDSLVIRLNGKEQSFDQRLLKLFVKEGDCIEIYNYLSNEDYVLELKDINNNIKNISEAEINITNKSYELFVVNLE